MPAFKDLKGLKFNRLKVMEYLGKSMWKVECDCGSIKAVKGSYITSGRTKSCGCYIKEVLKEVNKKHGLHGTKIYTSWRGMKERCTNPKHKNYKTYSKLGIQESWLEFLNFYEDMKDSYEEGLEIERINNELGYSKENCKWATRKEQTLNKEKMKGTSSIYRGVSWNKLNSNWRAYVSCDGVHTNLGSFKDELEAAKAVDKFIIDNNLSNRRNFGG